MINRKFFFTSARTNLFGGSMTAKQVQGLTAILNEWEAKYAAKDDRWLAYMLATAHHETGRTMQPIEEWGKGKKPPLWQTHQDVAKTLCRHHRNLLRTWLCATHLVRKL